MPRSPANMFQMANGRAPPSMASLAARRFWPRSPSSTQPSSSPERTRMDSAIDDIAKNEYANGVSPLAAVRQLCRSLGSAPNLKRLLEDTLAEFNMQNFQHTQRREEFRDVLAHVHKH